MFAHVLARGGRVREVLQAKAEMVIEKYLTTRHRGARKHSIAYQLECLAMAHDRAWSAYVPKPYDGKVILLRAQRQPFGIIADPTLGWQGLFTGDFQVQEVPGFRQTMLDEPNVEIVASILRDALRMCERSEGARSFSTVTV
jgi:thioesterase domain-containing protein